MRSQHPIPMTMRLFNSIILSLFVLMITSCGSNSYFSIENRPTSYIKPKPKINVFVMPKTRLNLYKKKVLMIPVFMAGNQEEIWGPSVTRLIRSIFLQESVFSTLALAPNNNIDRNDMLVRAREQGYDYLLEIVLPGILEPAGNSPGWVGINLFLRSTKKGFSLWQIYGETQLLPRVTQHRFFGRDDFVPAPSVGQGIVSITRIMAQILRGPSTQLSYNSL